MTSSNISNLRQWLIQIAYYTALGIGLISLKYNFKRRQFTKSKPLKCYAALCNFLFIFTSPVLFFKSVEENIFFAGNPHMKHIHILNVILRCIVVNLTLVFRRQRERKMKELIESIVQLEQEYFERVSYPHDLLKLYDRVFLLKYMCVVNQSISAGFLVYRFRRHNSVWWYGLCGFVVIVWNILLGVVLHYCLHLLHIGSRFDILNYRLKEIFRTLQRLSRRSQTFLQQALSVEVDNITFIHAKLRKLTHKLNGTFKFQIMTVLLTQVLNCVVMGYYSVMAIWSPGQLHMTKVEVVVCWLNYCLLLLDMHLVGVSCNGVQRGYKETSVLLRKFYEIKAVERCLDRSGEILSLHLLQEDLCINIAGMFNLNNRTSFVMIGFLLCHIVVLVQNDLTQSG